MPTKLVRATGPFLVLQLQGSLNAATVSLQAAGVRTAIPHKRDQPRPYCSAALTRAPGHSYAIDLQFCLFVRSHKSAPQPLRQPKTNLPHCTVSVRRTRVDLSYRLLVDVVSRHCSCHTPGTSWR